jgi:hypothetical protein
VCGVEEPRLSVDDALDTIRTLGRRYREAFTGVPPAARFERPEPSAWSMADHTVHVRDVLQLHAAALHVVFDTHHPHFDELEPSARPERAGVDLAEELDALDEAARSLATRGGRASTLAWDRPFDVGGVEHHARWLVQHAAHEGAHHLRELQRVRRIVAPSDDD